MDVALILRKLFCLGVMSVCLSACGEGVTVTPVAPIVAQAPAPKATTPDCTTQSGSFQLVATGFAIDTAGTATYKLFPCDHYAFIFLPALSGPSNATAFAASPLPSLLIPATIEHQEAGLHGFDNDAEQALMSAVLQAGSDVITFTRNGDIAGWTASGSKGVGLQVITVFLD